MTHMRQSRPDGSGTTQLKAQGPARICNGSKEEKEGEEAHLDSEAERVGASDEEVPGEILVFMKN